MCLSAVSITTQPLSDSRLSLITPCPLSVSLKRPGYPTLADKWWEAWKIMLYKWESKSSHILYTTTKSDRILRGDEKFLQSTLITVLNPCYSPMTFLYSPVNSLWLWAGFIGHSVVSSPLLRIILFLLFPFSGVWTPARIPQHQGWGASMASCRGLSWPLMCKHCHQELGKLCCKPCGSTFPVLCHSSWWVTLPAIVLLYLYSWMHITVQYCIVF